MNVVDTNKRWVNQRLNQMEGNLPLALATVFVGALSSCNSEFEKNRIDFANKAVDSFINILRGPE